MWDHNTGCASIEGGGERELVVLGHANDHEGAALRVCLCCVNSTVVVSVKFD